MNKIIFSVIIPVYNTAKFLNTSIESVINQKIKEIEIICIDDGSTDSSFYVLCQWEKRDSRIKVISQNNTGASAARNKGMLQAVGKYIVFLDSDDYLLEDALKNIYDVMEKDGLDICFFDSIAGGEDKSMVTSYKGIRRNQYSGVYCGTELMELFDESDIHNVVPWGAVYQREFLINNNLFFKEGIILEDNLFYLQTLMKAKRVSVINKIFYFYYRRIDSVTGKRNLVKQYISMAVIFEEINKYFINNNITFSEQMGICNFLTSMYRNIFNISTMIIQQNKEKELIEEIEKQRTFNNMWLSAWVFDDVYFRLKNKDNLLEIKRYDNILIYGAGKNGKSVAKWLSDNGVDRFIFVTSEVNNGYCMGNKIENVDKVASKLKSGIVLIAVGAKYRYEAINKVRKYSNLKYICTG